MVGLACLRCVSEMSFLRARTKCANLRELQDKHHPKLHAASAVSSCGRWSPNAVTRESMTWIPAFVASGVIVHPVGPGGTAPLSATANQ